ncbi:hypothetical protein [Flagellimonas meridianipacifica]|nr:hypothetical protein [Allomuricauda pacifica]
MGLKNLGKGYKIDLIFVGREKKEQAAFRRLFFCAGRGGRETKLVSRLPQVLGTRTSSVKFWSYIAVSKKVHILDRAYLKFTIWACLIFGLPNQI